MTVVDSNSDSGSGGPSSGPLKGLSSDHPAGDHMSDGDDPANAGKSAPLPSPWRAALSGLIAAAMALAAGELITGIANEPSLVSAVGEAVIDFTPGSGAQEANQILGSTNKPALIVGTIVLSLVFGSVLGLWSRRSRLPGVIGFAAFGLVGALAGARVEIASTRVLAFAAFVAVVAGLATLLLLLHKATRVALAAQNPAADSRDTANAGSQSGVANRAANGVATRPVRGMASAPAARRQFLTWAGVGSVAAGSIALTGRQAGSGSTAEAARSQVVLPEAANAGSTSTTPTTASGSAPSVAGFLDAEVPGITPVIVPNDEFYRIDTALVVPQVDPATWTMKVEGMVDNPFELNFEELLAMDMVEEAVTLSCVSNEVGGDLVGNAVWQGVPLLDILERAGVQPEAEQLVSTSVDGWNCGFPLDVLDGRPAMVAVAQNGEPLPVIHGFPARLVVSGLYGYVSATKWLSSVRLARWDDFDGYWIPRGWSKLGPIKTQSRIDVPGANISPGVNPIAGVAWAGERGIDRVEVAINDGPWQECSLGEEMARTSWRQWVFNWDAPEGTYIIRCRATDGAGIVQTDAPAPVAPDGAQGHHAIRVQVST